MLHIARPKTGSFLEARDDLLGNFAVSAEQIIGALNPKRESKRLARSRKRSPRNLARFVNDSLVEASPY